MQIGFDISQTGGAKAGCGFYADTLMQHLLRDYPDDTFILYRTFGNTYWEPEYRQKIKPNIPANATFMGAPASREDSFAMWGNPKGVNEVSIGSPDLVHSNNFSAPRLSSARLVYTLYDLSFIDVPDCTTEQNRLTCFEGVFQASFLADMMIAISHYTKKRFLENFPHFPAERIQVAHLGNRLPVEGEENPVKELVSLETEFFLAVGTLEPRKNLRRLLLAYREYLRHIDQPKPLVLAGGKGWMEDDLEEYITRLGIREHIYVLGYVSDATLRWLYRHCWAFIYPSLYEGFGLPVLEAMSLGAAVITSETTSLPEVGGDAVLYINPLEPDSITPALVRVENPDTRQHLRAQGKLRSQQFSWQQTAQIVHQVYQDTLALPPHNRFALDQVAVR